MTHDVNVITLELSQEDLCNLLSSQDFHKLEEWGNIQGLAQILGTDLKNGLPQSEILTDFSARIASYPYLVISIPLFIP